MSFVIFTGTLDDVTGGSVEVDVGMVVGNVVLVVVAMIADRFFLIELFMAFGFIDRIFRDIEVSMNPPWWVIFSIL